MDTVCPKCNYNNEITFGVKGHNLEDMVINFRCHQCKMLGTIIVHFDEETPDEVEWSNIDYIG